MSVASPFDLHDRVVVVTGGAGQLGRAFTKALMAAGARIAVIDRAPVEESEGVLGFACDITDRQALEEALGLMEDRWGTPFGLVNAAALNSPPDSPPRRTARSRPIPRLPSTRSWASM